MFCSQFIFILSFASAYVMFHFVGDNVPDPPENVHVISVTKSDIVVEWDHAKTKPCCPVLAYTVHYSEHPGGGKLGHFFINTAK